MPHSFKGVNFNNLLVYPIANKKTGVTAVLFNVPDLIKYLTKKGVPFKVLLLIDNAQRDPQVL